MTIRLFYDRWPQYERRLVDSLRDLTPEQLALRAAPEHWPIWAIAGHVAGASQGQRRRAQVVHGERAAVNPAVAVGAGHVAVERVSAARGAEDEVFLAADDASFITGATLSINGGQFMC